MRAFFCLQLPERIQSEMAETADLVESPAYVKWVKTQNLHITLKFLGEIEKSKIASLKQRAEHATKGSAQFEVTIDKLGAFPRLGYPKVIWLGASNEPEEIFTLHQSLEENLTSLGFDKEDRDYVPHITLGRTKEDDSRKIERLGSSLKSLQLESEWKVPIRNLTLMQSELKQSGPIYKEIFRVPLGGQD